MPTMQQCGVETKQRQVLNKKKYILQYPSGTSRVFSTILCRATRAA